MSVAVKFACCHEPIAQQSSTASAGATVVASITSVDAPEVLPLKPGEMTVPRMTKRRFRRFRPSHESD